MKELIKKHFDHGASGYAEQALVQKRIATELLRETVGYVTEKGLLSPSSDGTLFERCLDLGCGPGINYPELKLYAKRITGIDLSPKMIAKAADLGIPGTESLVADMERLSLPDRYDFIYSSLAMQWCNTPEVMMSLNDLKTAERKCTVAISLPGSGTLKELRNALETVGAGNRTCMFSDFAETEEAAHKAFGKGISVHERIFTDRHHDIKSYLGAIKDIGANTTSQPKPMSKSQYSELMIYLQKRLEAEGYLSHTYPVVFIYGVI